VQELLPQAGILGDGVGADLERVVRIADAFQNPVVFATRLLEIAGRVCWVEILAGSGRSSGTGFLVGPDLVLTNHHVLADVIDGRTPPTAVHCVFDYHIRADGTPDRGVALGLADDWLVAARPPSAVDEQPVPDGEPAPDELDYALVRLTGRPGDANLPGGRTRGWVDVTAAPPAVTEGTPLLIVQHPDGHPQKLAIDTDGVLGVNTNATRFRYGVNTLDGSSGSPCLTFDLALLGLHHSGTKDRRVGRNESVPIAAIVADLRARGHSSVLPG
ncbi:MAG: trypsin-like peptidase domain-containing protein, partial [Pseudonocardia sp.]|nr:trypsin-like peptidase domain-containing protein [Pseudonocardia sp.]